MTDLLCISVSKSSSLDRDENTTNGFAVSIQVWRFVFEVWFTFRGRNS